MTKLKLELDIYDLIKLEYLIHTAEKKQEEYKEIMKDDINTVKEYNISIEHGQKILKEVKKLMKKHNPNLY